MCVVRWMLCFILIGTTGVYAQDAERKGTPPTLENVAYGPYERNVLDFWRAESDAPAPVLIFIHGGGFASGNKRRVRGNVVVETCLEKGVSFAAINYRFKNTAPIQDILRDAARAVQFIRYNAEAWHVDPERIASYGGSAGAGTSMWLAFHDDLADPDSEDPVLRQSSRIVAAGSLNGQFSYDFFQWESVLGLPAENFYSENTGVAFYGLATFDEAETEKGKRIRADVDMRGLITKDDPPVFLFCSQRGGVPQNRGHYVHHPKHSIVIKERCDETGVEVEMYLPKMGSPPPGNTNQAMLAFFFKHLKVE